MVRLDINADKEYLDQLLNELSKNSHNPDCLVKIGRLYFEPFHDPKKSLFYLQSAVEIDANHLQSYFWMAKVFYHDYCDYEQTKQLLEKIIAKQPDKPECLSLLASVLGDLDVPTPPRIHLLKQAVHLAPDWVIPRYNLAILLVETGQLQEAGTLVYEGLKLIKPVAQPSNPLDYYYENAVTGRAWRGGAEELKKVLQNEK